MRILFVTNPGLGHWHPMLPFAAALRAAEHDVRVACARRFGPVIESGGFSATPTGLDWLESELLDTFPELARLVARGQYLRVLSDLFADTAARRMVPDLLELCRTWSPHLIVRNDYEFGSSIVAEQLAIPLATIGIMVPMPGSLWHSVVGRPLTFLRQAFGLTGYAAMRGVTGELCLSLLPPAYRPRGGPDRIRVVAVQPRPLAMPTPASAATIWARTAGRRGVYVSLGTVFNRRRPVLARLVRVLGTVDADVLLTTGGPGADPGDAPPNVTICEYVPQDQVLPRADLVVTTGGFNTVLGALRWGLPFLVLPAAADHFAHAARCEELGVGRALHPRAAADGTLTDPEEPELRAAIEDLLAAPAYRARAAALRDSLAGVPDERHGAALLAEVAARGAVRASAFTELDGARS